MRQSHATVTTVLAGLAVVMAIALPAAAATAPVADGPALAALLSMKGLGCGMFTPDAGVNGASSGTCDVLGHEANVAVAVYSSAATLKRALPRLSTSICKALRSANVHRKLHLTSTSNWLAIFEDKFSAGRVKSVLKAKIRTLAC